MQGKEDAVGGNVCDHNRYGDAVSRNMGNHTRYGDAVGGNV